MRRETHLNSYLLIVFLLISVFVLSACQGDVGGLDSGAQVVEAGAEVTEPAAEDAGAEEPAAEE